MRTPNRDPLQKRHQREQPGYHRPATQLVPDHILQKKALTRFIMLAELHGYGEEPSEQRPLSAKSLFARTIVFRSLTESIRKMRTGPSPNDSLFGRAVCLRCVALSDRDRNPDIDRAWERVRETLQTSILNPDRGS